MNALKIVGWAAAGAIVAGVLGFAVFIILPEATQLGGGDPATKGIGAGLIAEGLFLAGIVVGTIIGGVFGWMRHLKSRKPR